MLRKRHPTATAGQARYGLSGAISVIAVGYRFGEKEVTKEPGEVKHVFNYPNDALWKGHTIGYTSNVVQGMSGGGIFDGKNLVGINANGKGSNRFNISIVLNGKVQSKNIFKRIDGQPISDELKSEYNNYSWGISIDTICTVFPNACPKASTSDDQGL